MNDPVRVDPIPHSGNVAEVVGLTYLYGKTVAVDDITLQFLAGKTLGLIGPDGVGKSTLLGGVPEDVNRASVAFVDEDQSTLSRNMRSAIYPPYLKVPEAITADEIDKAMDAGRFLFVVVIPPHFESDLRQGRSPEIQVNIDATAVRQAALGAGYIQAILTKEISRFIRRTDTVVRQPINLVKRKAFNPVNTTTQSYRHPWLET
jgi:energy-coupling factor transporter ATP-binding protein EcfA2